MTATFPRALAVENQASVIMKRRYRLEILISFLLRVYPEAGLLGHVAVPSLILLGTSTLFPTVAATFDFLASFPLTLSPTQLPPRLTARL